MTSPTLATLRFWILLSENVSVRVIECQTKKEPNGKYTESDIDRNRGEKGDDATSTLAKLQTMVASRSTQANAK